MDVKMVSELIMAFFGEKEFLACIFFPVHH